MSDEEQKPEMIEAPGTILGYPCRFTIADIPTAPKIVLAGHRQPQRMSLFMAWYVLRHFTEKLVEGLASVPREPEGIFVMNFGVLKLRPEEAIMFEQRAGSGLVSPGGVPLPKVGA